MIFKNRIFKIGLRTLGTIVLAMTCLAGNMRAQAASQGSAPTGQPVDLRPVLHSTNRPSSPYKPAGMPGSARGFYQMNWGIDPLEVKQVSSGLMIRFSYRVLDEEKAKAVTDKKFEPYLLDERAHVKLVVPTLEKVGQLRQTGTLENGKIYWIVFSNKEQFVKVGDRVSIVIGNFRVDGLVVE